MARYKILIRKSVYKDIDKVPKKDIKRILDGIAGLAENPRPPQSKKLSGEEKYRLRCGSYRVLYEIQDEVLLVYIVRARHRKEVYRP